MQFACYPVLLMGFLRACQCTSILDTKLKDMGSLPCYSVASSTSPRIFPFSFKANEQKNGWDLRVGAERCVQCTLEHMPGHQIQGCAFMHLCPAATHVHLCWPVSVIFPKLASTGGEHVCVSTYEHEWTCVQGKGNFRGIVSMCVFSKCLAFFKMA